MTRDIAADVGVEHHSASDTSSESDTFSTADSPNEVASGSGGLWLHAALRPSPRTRTPHVDCVKDLESSTIVVRTLLAEVEGEDFAVKEIESEVSNEYEHENESAIDDPEEEFLRLMRESLAKRDSFEKKYSGRFGIVENTEGFEREQEEFGRRERERDMKLKDGIVFEPRRERGRGDEDEDSEMKSSYYSAPELQHIRPAPPRRRGTPFPGLIEDDEDEDVDEEDEGLSFPNSPPSSPPSPISSPATTTTATTSQINLTNHNLTTSSINPTTKTLQEALKLIRSHMNSIDTSVKENVFEQVQELYSTSSSAISSPPSSTPSSHPAQIDIADLDSLPDFYLKTGPRETMKASRAILKSVLVCAVVERGLEALMEIRGEVGERSMGGGEEGLMGICVKRPARVEKTMEAALRGIEGVLAERPGGKRRP